VKDKNTTKQRLAGVTALSEDIAGLDPSDAHFISLEDIRRNPHLYVNNANENPRRGGDRVWVAWTNRPVYDEAGRVIEILCIGNDITERKRAEEALGKSERVTRSGWK
jgi:PAS domain S-box-containing protein